MLSKDSVNYISRSPNCTRWWVPQSMVDSINTWWVGEVCLNLSNREFIHHKWAGDLTHPDYLADLEVRWNLILLLEVLVVKADLEGRVWQAWQAIGIKETWRNRTCNGIIQILMLYRIQMIILIKKKKHVSNCPMWEVYKTLGHQPIWSKDKTINRKNSQLVKKSMLNKISNLK